MADEMVTKEKIYCMPQHDNSYLLAELMNAKNQGVDAATMSALFSKNNNTYDNPWIWLIWLAWMGNGGMFGNNRADVAQNNDLARQVATLQGTVTDNHNNDLALNAINGNRDALGQLAQTFNTDITAIQSAICSVKSAIEKVGGEVGYTSESIKNAIALGDSNIMSKMCECCNTTQQNILKMGYENQLATERQTNTLGGQIAEFKAADQLQTCQQTNTLNNSINDVRQAVVNGFANIGYQNSQNTAQIIQNATANTQRILDQMNANSTQELRDKLAQMSQEAQTQTILNKIGCGCGC